MLKKSYLIPKTFWIMTVMSSQVLTILTPLMGIKSCLDLCLIHPFSYTSIYQGFQYNLKQIAGFSRVTSWINKFWKNVSNITLLFAKKELTPPFEVGNGFHLLTVLYIESCECIHFKFLWVNKTNIFPTNSHSSQLNHKLLSWAPYSFLLQQAGRQNEYSRLDWCCEMTICFFA